MKKYLLVLVGLCCVLSYALAERPDYPELKKSDANIIGHVLDKKTKEHLPYDWQCTVCSTLYSRFPEYECRA